MKNRTVVSKQTEMLQVIKNKTLDSAAVLLCISSGVMCAAVHASKSQTRPFHQ